MAVLRGVKALSSYSGATRGSVCLLAPGRRAWMVPGEPGHPGGSAAGHAVEVCHHPFATVTAHGRCACVWPSLSGQWERQQPGSCFPNSSLLLLWHWVCSHRVVQLQGALAAEPMRSAQDLHFGNSPSMQDLSLQRGMVGRSQGAPANSGSCCHKTSSVP